MLKGMFVSENSTQKIEEYSFDDEKFLNEKIDFTALKICKMYREYNRIGFWYSDSKDDWVKIESMSPPQLHNTISKCERYIREIKDPRIVAFYKTKLAELEFYLT